ncbi:hypothetical protein N8J89_35665 [Crossiella sp. CA-258035]|uniref:hypothetical protein n=1 Tax=Crossiella sp. CA-258035 TaxID=2981138 RepID=UPI0024BCC625|nr:hypothetical protein [Crossiella sp. CA-258035]WHT18396.1 hypothetical protein N8J89_35665 [Crossiella sp. CA-258035]
MIDVERAMEQWGEQGVLSLLQLGPGTPWRLWLPGEHREGATLAECFAGLPARQDGSIDVELLMSELAGRGLNVLLKLDHERWAERGKPWTLLVEEEPGFSARVDARTMREAFEVVLARLRARSAGWEWTVELL